MELRHKIQIGDLVEFLFSYEQKALGIVKDVNRSPIKCSSDFTPIFILDLIVETGKVCSYNVWDNERVKIIEILAR